MTEIVKNRVTEELRRSEERFRGAFVNAATGMCLVAPDGRFLQVNRSLCDMLGYSESELLATTFWSITLPEDLEKSAEMVRRMIGGEASCLHFEKRYRHKTGTVVWAHVGTTLLRDSRKEPLYFITEIQDITRRRRAEEERDRTHDLLEKRVQERTSELARTNQQLQQEVEERRKAEEELRFRKTLLESQSEAAIDGILVVDSGGRMISFNRRFVEMWGLPADIIESRSDDRALAWVLDKLVDPDGFLARVRYLYDHPDEKSQDEIALKDGRVIDRYSAPVRSVEGMDYGRVWFFRDVTERKRAQEQLIRSEKLASIGMLVSGVAHEINNPLNVIYGNLKLLKQACKGTGKEKTGGMLRDAVKAAEEARTILEDFRSFARDTRSADPVNLLPCLEEAAALIQAREKSRLRFVKKLRPLPPLRCFPGQMKQVFINLLQNATEAIDEKGTVTLSASRKGGHVIVEVADTGRGILAKVRNKVFEPFFTTKPLGRGLGLGLTISAAIIHNHGGEITVRSRPGRGTAFRVRLPIPRR